MKRALWPILFIGAALLAAAAVLTRTTDAGVSLKPDEPPVVAAGQQLYAVHCAACHGVNLEGQPNWQQRGPDGLLPAPPHDRTGHTWHHPDEMLIKMTKLGPVRMNDGNYKSAMPGYEGILSDDQIVAVLSYIKSRWPADIRARHDDINRRYADEKKQ